MKLREKDYIRCIHELKHFSVLNEEELKFIGQKHNKLTYQAGEYICKQGAFASQIMYVKKGLVKLISEADNESTILTLETNDSFLGLQVLYSTELFPYSVIACTESEICLFDVHDFGELVERNGEFAKMVVTNLNDYALRSFTRLNSLSHKQLHGRLADIFLCLSERIYFADKFLMELSRKDLAELTAMSCESLSRVIKDFNEEGIVRVDGKDVEILHKDRLSIISKTG